MKLQIAIDSMAPDRAMKFAESVEHYGDIIEIGTPLIYRYGIDLIKEAASCLSNAKLLADAKIVDAGSLESRMFLESGADIVTLLAGANEKTIEEARALTEDYQAGLMIDLINIPIPETINRIEELQQLGCSNFCLHRPTDVRNIKELYLPDLSSAPNLTLAVAGGINLQNIHGVIDYAPDVIVIGSAITQHEDPEGQARKFAEIIHNEE